MLAFSSGSVELAVGEKNRKALVFNPNKARNRINLRIFCSFKYFQTNDDFFTVYSCQFNLLTKLHKLLIYSYFLLQDKILNSS